ncbi:MAG: acyltransferase family protein [Archangium sp.]
MNAPQRYDGLDAVRAGAMLLGLAYHATYSWLPRVAPWYFVADSSPVDALVFVTGFLHGWRMQLFFVLSGFFSHLVFDRRGPGFLRERTRKLLIPMLVALPVVLACDFAVRRASFEWGLMSPEYAKGAGLRFSPVHLWFLIYLWCFHVVAWVVPSTTLFSARALKFPPVLLLLAVPTCVGLWLHPENKPDLFFWPQPFEFFHYGLFFSFGWWLWRHRQHVGALQAFAPYFLVAGLALGAWIFTGTRQWQPEGQVLAGVMAWLISLGAVGLAFSMKSAERPGLRLLVDASYWTYLVHFPLVLVLQLLFARVEWPGLAEYFATVTFTFAICLTSFVVLVRRSALAPWLGVRAR